MYIIYTVVINAQDPKWCHTDIQCTIEDTGHILYPISAQDHGEVVIKNGESLIAQLGML